MILSRHDSVSLFLRLRFAAPRAPLRDWCRLARISGSLFPTAPQKLSHSLSRFVFFLLYTCDDTQQNSKTSPSSQRAAMVFNTRPIHTACGRRFLTYKLLTKLYTKKPMSNKFHELTKGLAQSVIRRGAL